MTTRKIDAALNALCQIVPPGHTLTHRAIAEYCGCDKELIRLLERKAIKNFRARLIKSLQHTSFADARRDALSSVSRPAF